MAALDYIKRVGTPVFLNVQDSQWRNIVPKKLQSGLKSYPYVYVTDNTYKREFGIFQHSQLKSQDFAKIFRGAKKAIREAKNDGTLHSGAEKAVIKTATSSDDSETVKPATTEYETWVSAKGNTIEAKLVGFYSISNSYKFQLRNNKIITVNAAELDPDSLEKAEKLVAEK